MTIAVVSHDYDFIDAVCTDVTHYDNGGDLGKPCRFVYYPMTFSEFQRLKPEIAAGLPHADKGVATAAQVVGENKTPSESDASSEKGMGSRSSSVRAPGRVSDPRRLPHARAYRQQLTSRASPPLCRWARGWTACRSRATTRRRAPASRRRSTVSTR